MFAFFFKIIKYYYKTGVELQGFACPLTFFLVRTSSI